MADPAPDAAAPPYDNWTWNDAPLAPERIVVVDIDGVISDASHRQHFLAGDDRDWKGFFEAAEHDPPIPSFVHVLNLFDPALGVVLLTARPHYMHDITVAWLGKNGIRWDALIMRHKKDGNLQSPAFKRRSLRELRVQGYEVEAGFDDDIRNVEVIIDEGHHGIYIHSGYYE